MKGKLAEGGQGVVYNVSYDGKSKALKKRTAAFFFDKDDDSNASVPRTNNNAIKLWAFYSFNVRDKFMEAFSQNALADMFLYETITS